ncbi:MAG: hypothetical protein ACK4FK_12430 [Ferrovibrio sp.]|jgi:hypothetical protein|uniref:hypothetical protein n=1 Tax=Ferrovibrio sp. TaxID=1917215 RepID=UPI00391C0D9D
MRPRPLLLQAVTKADRHLAVAATNDSLLTYGGWIVDSHFFSNKAATIRLVIPANRLPDWLDQLNQAGLKFDPIDPPPQADGEISISLSITFIHDEPDLARDIPAVPG